MYEALFRQDFKDVRIRMEPNARLSLTLTNSRISQMSRAVGRAARTTLLLAPLETTEIRVTYTTNACLWRPMSSPICASSIATSTAC